MQNNLNDLIHQLSGTEPEVASASAELVQIGEAAVEPLIAALLYDPYRARVAAQRCLLFIGAPAVPALIRALEQNYNSLLQHRAAELLGRLRDDRAVEALLTALDDPISYVRAISAKALGLIGDSRAAAPLVRLLSENKAAVRAAAAEALGSIDVAEVVAPLINTLGDTQVSVRDAAAQALVLQPHPSTTTSLLA